VRPISVAAVCSPEPLPGQQRPAVGDDPGAHLALQVVDLAELLRLVIPLL
jgi:hypothetical protein